MAKKKYDELLQSQFFDGRRVVPDERLLCYPARNVSQVDGYLFRSVSQLVKHMLSFARIYVVSARILGGVNCPPDPPSHTPMCMN